MQKKISVVLPCHNEAENLTLLIPEIIKNIPKKYDYEIICVDDGSMDNTWEVIKSCAQKNKKIKGVSFHRNFKHQQALKGGMEKASGDVIITMDADFQHPPQVIREFIASWEKGHDLVQAKKTIDPTTSLGKNIVRNICYSIWSKISDGILIPGISDFRLMSRPIAKYICHSSERELFLRGQVQLAAKNPAIITYKVGKRKYGNSSYDSKILINMFLNGFISFSSKPLRMAWILGLIISGLATIYILIDIILSIISGRSTIEGYKTIVILLLVLDGFIIFYLGVLGEYIGVIFKESKGRPGYIIDKTINLK